MKTSKWNLATLPCPLCPAPAPCLRPACLRPALPLALALALALCCPALPLPSLKMESCNPAFPFSSQKVAKRDFEVSGLEKLKMESCNPAPASVPCPCTCLRPACLHPGPGPVLPCPSLPLFLKKLQNVILRFSGLEKPQNGILQPCPAPAPWPCTLPAPCLPCKPCHSLSPGLGPALCCPAPKPSEPKPCPALPSPFFSKRDFEVFSPGKPQNGILQPCPALCALPLHPACALPALHPALPLALAFPGPPLSSQKVAKT